MVVKMEAELPVGAGALVPLVEPLAELLVAVAALEQMEVELLVVADALVLQVVLVEADELVVVVALHRHRRLGYASQVSQQAPPSDSPVLVEVDEHRLGNLEHHLATLARRHRHRLVPRLQGSHEAQVVDQPCEVSASDLA